MTRPVRASRPEGLYTTTRHHANRRGHNVLEDHPAVDEHGRWLPPTTRKNITRIEPTPGEEEA